MPNNPGYVNPGEDIESAWGNKVVGRTVPTFTDSADRDTSLPAPEHGQLCYVQSTDRVLQFDGATWGVINYAWLESQYLPLDDTVPEIEDVSTTYSMVRATRLSNVVTLALHFKRNLGTSPGQLVGTLSARFRPGGAATDYLTGWVDTELEYVDDPVNPLTRSRQFWVYPTGEVKVGDMQGGIKYRGVLTYVVGARALESSIPGLE